MNDERKELNRKLFVLYQDGFPKDSDGYVSYFVARQKIENILTYYADNKLISAGYIVPKKIYLAGELLPMSYLSAISTSSNYRGQGLASKIMQSAFDTLYDRGEVITALYPFNHEYYLRYGYANISHCVSRLISGGHNYLVRAAEKSDIPVMIEIYRNMAERFDGYIVCDEKYFEDMFSDAAIDSDKIYIVSDKHSPFAYVVVENGQITKYASTKFSKLIKTAFFKGMTIKDFAVRKKAYAQGRIINVKKFLSLNLYKDGFSEAIISVTDNEIDANTAVYKIVKTKNGKISVTNTTEKPNYSYSVQHLLSRSLNGKDIFKKQKLLFIDKY